MILNLELQTISPEFFLKKGPLNKIYDFFKQPSDPKSKKNIMFI